MQITSIEINRGMINRVEVRHCKRQDTGAQYALMRVVYNDEDLKATVWMKSLRREIENGKFPRVLADHGFNPNEKIKIIETIQAVFHNNDKKENWGNIEIDGEKSSVEFMLHTLHDVLWKHWENQKDSPEEHNIWIDDTDIYIESKYFNEIANEVYADTKYKRIDILRELKGEGWLKISKGRPYDYQISGGARCIVITKKGLCRLEDPEKERGADKETDGSMDETQGAADMDDALYAENLSFFTHWGSKKKMVSEIRMLMPEHKVYAELYGGSAAVLLNHPRSQKEILCEMDDEIFTLYKVLADKETAKELLELIKTLEYGKGMFDKALKAKEKGYEGMGEVLKAYYVYILHTQSYNGCMKNYSKEKPVDYSVSSYFNLKDVAKRLAGVELYNGDAMDVFKKLKNDKDAFVLLDPPYWQGYRAVGARKVYRVEADEQAQYNMLEKIRDAECKIMLCGYRPEKGSCPYDQVLGAGKKRKDWHCYLLKEMPKPGKKGVKAKEFIWVNYELSEGWEYVITTKDYFQP